jgi:hypothetical protein
MALTRAGYLTAVRGRSGGLKLAGGSQQLRAQPHGHKAMGAGAHRGRRQAGGQRLVAGRAAAWRNLHRRAVIGGAEDDRLVGADGVQVEDGAGAREEDERPRCRRALPKKADQRHLRGRIQAVLQHVDELHGGAFGLKRRQKGDKGVAGVAVAVGDGVEGAANAGGELRSGTPAADRRR